MLRMFFLFALYCNFFFFFLLLMYTVQDFFLLSNNEYGVKKQWTPRPTKHTNKLHILHFCNRAKHNERLQYFTFPCILKDTSFKRRTVLPQTIYTFLIVAMVSLPATGKLR